MSAARGASRGFTDAHPCRQAAGEEVAGLGPGQGKGAVEPYGAVGPLSLGVVVLELLCRAEPMIRREPLLSASVAVTMTSREVAVSGRATMRR